MTTAALTASAAASSAGVMALVIGRWRTLRRWLGVSALD
jgi:hypothetical protein